MVTRRRPLIKASVHDPDTPVKPDIPLDKPAQASHTRVKPAALLDERDQLRLALAILNLLLFSLDLATTAEWIHFGCAVSSLILQQLDERFEAGEHGGVRLAYTVTRDLLFLSLVFKPTSSGQPQLEHTTTSQTPAPTSPKVAKISHLAQVLEKLANKVVANQSMPLPHSTHTTSQLLSSPTSPKVAEASHLAQFLEQLAKNIVAKQSIRLPHSAHTTSQVLSSPTSTPIPFADRPVALCRHDWYGQRFRQLCSSADPVACMKLLKDLCRVKPAMNGYRTETGG
ncbi:hypothetical protein IWZ01DRAFT_524463 [Phyllosticta capitalensis]